MPRDMAMEWPGTRIIGVVLNDDVPEGSEIVGIAALGVGGVDY